MEIVNLDGYTEPITKLIPAKTTIEMVTLTFPKVGKSKNDVRHTFATTIMLSNGVPIETVSRLLGHTKLSTTQIYARVLEHKISEDIENLMKRFETKKNQRISLIKN